MVTASHYVIKNMSMVLESRDLVETNEMFKKFSVRYSDDIKLMCICNEYSKYLKSRDPEKLDEIKSALERLKVTRKRETSGGTRLWFKDRRPGVMQLIKIT